MIKVAVTPHDVNNRRYVSFARSVGNNKAIHECVVFADGAREYRVFGRPNTAVVAMLPASRMNRSFMTLLDLCTYEARTLAELKFDHPRFRNYYAASRNRIASISTGIECQIVYSDPLLTNGIAYRHMGRDSWIACRNGLTLHEATSADGLDSWLQERGIQPSRLPDPPVVEPSESQRRYESLYTYQAMYRPGRPESSSFSRFVDRMMREQRANEISEAERHELERRERARIELEQEQLRWFNAPSLAEQMQRERTEPRPRDEQRIEIRPMYMTYELAPSDFEVPLPMDRDEDDSHEV